MHKKITKIEAARDDALNGLLGPLGLSAEDLLLSLDDPIPQLEDLFPKGVPDVDDFAFSDAGPDRHVPASSPERTVPTVAKTTSTRRKRRITIWLDHDVIDDFKRRAGKRGYQTLMARTLRDDLRHTRAARAPR